MKILFTFFIAFIFITSSALCFSQHHSEVNENNLKPDNYDLETGKRYLKLAMTYREASDTGKAEEYLRKGLKIVKKHNNIYWEAVAYEFLAYVLRDKHQPLKAIMMMEKALIMYDKIIKQEDGSQYAARRVMKIMKGDGDGNEKAMNKSKHKLHLPVTGVTEASTGMNIKDQIVMLSSQVKYIKNKLLDILAKRK